MPLGYRQVKDLYDTLYDAGVVTKSLPEWSQEMNESLGTDLYSAGQEDNWIKRTSVGIDRLLEKTGLPQAGEEFGRAVGEAVGDPEAGAYYGRGAARMGVNSLPLLLPGPGWIGAAGMAALSGAEAYTSTGSPTAGVLGAAMAGVSPAVGKFAEQAVLKRIGGKLVEGARLRPGPSNSAGTFPKRYRRESLVRRPGSWLQACWDWALISGSRWPPASRCAFPRQNSSLTSHLVRRRLRRRI